MSGTPLAGLVAMPIDEVRPSPNNPRERLTGVQELALSIQENGLIQPLVVQRVPGIDGVQVVAGHRRLAAVKNLGWRSVPCIIRKDMLPDEELLAMLVENGQRAGLDPIEEARALSRLKSTGLTDKEVGRKIGRSQMFVGTRLALLSLPVEHQEELRRGETTISAAAVVARQESGRVRPTAKGKKSAQHLSAHHDLARRVLNRCTSNKHKSKGAASVGGIGCGECWEAVIRADEREQLNAQSNARGRCVLCDTAQEPVSA